MKTAILDHRLQCPEAGFRRDRVSKVLTGLAQWITQDPLTELLDMFGRSVPPDWSTWPAGKVLGHLGVLEPWHQHCTLWDFRCLAARRGQRSDDGSEVTGAARLHDCPVVLDPDCGRRVVEIAHEIGLRRTTDAREREYDVVVSLGGLRLSPKLRTEWAVRQLTERGVSASSVALLGTRRPIQHDERQATDTYAPCAHSEFDLMVRGGIEAGLFSDADTPQVKRPHPEPEYELADWTIHTYPGRHGAAHVHVVSAPGPAPYVSRPNTAQTLEFMLSRPEFEGADRILMVTNATCVPYQQVEALRTIALPHNRVVEIIAVPLKPTAHLRGTHQPHNYLQEVRSMFQASLRLHADFGGSN